MVYEEAGCGEHNLVFLRSAIFSIVALCLPKVRGVNLYKGKNAEKKRGEKRKEL